MSSLEDEAKKEIEKAKEKVEEKLGEVGVEIKKAVSKINYRAGNYIGTAIRNKPFIVLIIIGVIIAFLASGTAYVDRWFHERSLQKQIEKKEKELTEKFETEKKTFDKESSNRKAKYESARQERDELRTKVAALEEKLKKAWIPPATDGELIERNTARGYHVWIKE